MAARPRQDQPAVPGGPGPPLQELGLKVVQLLGKRKAGRRTTGWMPPGTRRGGATRRTPSISCWLPHGANATRNVVAQGADPGSLLRLCRDLIALRSAEFRRRITRSRRWARCTGLEARPRHVARSVRN